MKHLSLAVTLMAGRSGCTCTEHNQLIRSCL